MSFGRFLNVPLFPAESARDLASLKQKKKPYPCSPWEGAASLSEQIRRGCLKLSCLLNLSLCGWLESNRERELPTSHAVGESLEANWGKIWVLITITTWENEMRVFSPNEIGSTCGCCVLSRGCWEAEGQREGWDKSIGGATADGRCLVFFSCDQISLWSLRCNMRLWLWPR